MMDIDKPCRTCLAKKAQKNVYELKHKDSTWSEIMLYCLDIKVTDNTEESTKLCMKCFRKILLFYKFKLQAQTNDTMLKLAKVESKIKHEVFVKDDDDIKDEENSNDYYDCFVNDGFGNDEVKIEFVESKDDSPSDDELLSVIKNIKYEYVSEENLDEAKENVFKRPTIIKRRKSRKRVSSVKDTTKQICEECGKSVRNLKEHMEIHKPAKLRLKLSCKMCSKTFSSYGARYKHTKTKHLGIKKTCKICNKSVINLRQHTLVVHEPSQMQHECPSCGRRFLNQSALDTHISVHSSDRPFSCDHCDKTFRTKIIMMQHIRQVHNKEKSHMCQYCSKSFFKKCHLQIHLRTHTKEKPYECTECGKFFTSSTILKNHKMLHYDTKEYSCTCCDMTFARPGYLRTHMISHTKEKKHPCKYCGVKFGRSDHRKRHEFTAHEKHMMTTA